MQCCCICEQCDHVSDGVSAPCMAAIPDFTVSHTHPLSVCTGALCLPVISYEEKHQVAEVPKLHWHPALICSPYCNV